MFDLDPVTDTLFCFALGLGASVVGVPGLLFGRRQHRVARWALPLIVGILLAAPAAVMAASGNGHSSFLPLVVLASFTVTLAAARTPLVEVVSRRFVEVLRQARVAPSCLAVLGLGVIGWQAYALDRRLAGETDLADVTIGKSVIRGIEPIPGWQVETDKGRNVQMMRAVLDPEAGPDDEAAYVHSLKLEIKVIRTSPGDEGYNCHGWVFGAGKAWISGVDVDSILEDNAYQTVSKPVAGDVVVFRDSAWKVSHTGLVRAVTEDGRVFLESKWGKMGRYLHTPEQHAYPTHQPTYYRSHRAGHQLRPAKYAPKPVADQ